MEFDAKLGACFLVTKALVKTLTPEQRKIAAIAVTSHIEGLYKDENSDPVQVRALENYINRLLF
ncbi:hypothetical protein GTGU_00152 [Trabulsiella guamensis ATCC 49490]|uniref:Uncharacterized protein n=2 Tax=Trabulsiella guamensis TaxID=158852 RepID=A0A085ASF3_9ENTR|nr:hypothetical protein GTGU_00152 [Trabulsiella guamensis ATCC 49490]